MDLSLRAVLFLVAAASLSVADGAAGAERVENAIETCGTAGVEADEGSMLALQIAPHKAKPVLTEPNWNGQIGFWCVGINAAGFDLDPLSGRNGYYSVPNKTAIQYFHDQGANCFRLPATWERLQTDPSTDVFDPLPEILDTINFITGTLKDRVIIDPHNGRRGFEYDGVPMERKHFVNLWKGIASHYGSNKRVIFALFNEPEGGKVGSNDHFFNTSLTDDDGALIKEFTAWMQDAINKVRARGAHNVILVPGLKFGTCRDWSGANWWGETIGSVTRAGNTRLASLTDPLDLLVYDVHQFLDTYITGLDTGCGGYIDNVWNPGPDETGAKWGLDQTIAWAQKYNKKFIMTEFASFMADPDDGTDADCQQKVSAYLQTMHDSGAFLGFTVWQFGCPCLGDQWALKPYNLEWYRWNDWKKSFKKHNGLKCFSQKNLVLQIESSVKSCKKKCSSDIRCAGFSRKGGSCWLFQALTNPRQCSASNKFTTWFYA